MMPTPRFARALGLILLLEAALLLPILGRATLSRIDETQIAEVSREMAESGDWVTPRIGAVPFPAYPPLQYWLLTLSGSAFGFNEFSMRLPTALAALALVAVSALLARRLAGDDAGIAAAMILATTPVLFLQGTVCRADVITMLFATTAFERFLAWTEPPEQGGRKNRDLALMYLSTALGILTKGPLTVAVLGLGGLAWFGLRRQWKLLLGMKFWFGIPAVALIVVPWYWAVYRANGWGFLNENLFLENLNAYSEGYQQKRPWTFYLRQCPVLLPWLLALPLAATVRKAPGVVLSLLWFVLVALFFQLSSAKRLNYLVYTAPPLAIAAATTLTAVWTGNAALFRRCLLGFGAVVALAGIALALVPGSIWTGGGVSKIASQMPLIGGGAAVGALGVAILALRYGACAGFGGMTVVLGAAFLVYGAFVNPRMNPENTEMAQFCRLVASKIPPGEALAVPPGGAEGFFHFYVGRTMPSQNGEPGLYLASEAQQ
ncbi:MAG: glycosyltransferase family 39 protein, partial [Planctomycetaceae bacterium]|nr:glycosyltransferase family 39 protein [Planctomycetaceae bacterium]